MLPFPIMNVYGNTTPTLGFEFSNNSSSFFALNKNTGDLYATTYNAVSAGFNVGYANSSSWTLTLTGVQKVFGTNNNSNGGSIVLMYDGTFKICGSKTPISGGVDSYTNWEDITSIFSAVGLSASDIKDISGYYNLKYTVLTNDGRVFCIGKNSTTTLSSFGTGNNVDSFGALMAVTTFPSTEKVIKCSGNFYVTDAHKLYGTGQNTNYQLGTGNVNSSTGLVLMNSDIIDVYAGYQNCYAITSDRVLMACGTQFGAQYGNEMGTGSTSRLTTLTVTNNDVKFFSVCVGNMSTHVIKSTNVLYSTGNNALAQLGDGTQVPISTYKNIISVSTDAILIRCNVGSLLYSTGKLYYSGRNDCAMGGNTSTYTKVYTEIPNLPFTI